MGGFFFLYFHCEMVEHTEEIKLEDYDDEDIYDVVAKLERSFGLNFDKDAFWLVQTFGDLCDVFERHIAFEPKRDCTTQQAFYRVRKAIGATQLMDENLIVPDSRLADIFPKQDRRTKIRAFKELLGVQVKILTYPDWLGRVLRAGFLLSFIAVFFDWKIALSAVVFLILIDRIAEKSGTTLTLQTVGQLSGKLVREHYVDIRRSETTVNREEIVPIIVDVFSNDLDIEKCYLTRDAKFSWAKYATCAVD